MADEVIRRSGSSADHGSFTGANGEWTHDTTLKAIRVHDGSQAGGYPIFHEGYVEEAPDGGTDAYSADARRPVSAGETVRADFTSANTTTTPTFENTQGTPSGALTITTKDGSALWAGALSGVHTLQLASGGGSWLVLDPNPSVQRDPTVSQPTMQVFTSSGTWTRPDNVRRVHIRVVGAGGGGAGSGQDGTQSGCGAGGGGGATAEAILDVSSISSATVSVGSGGSGGAIGNNPGSDGGNSEWSDGTNTVTAGGGQGAPESALSSGTALAEAGGNSTASGGDINSNGSAGGVGVVDSGNVRLSGYGGSSTLGGLSEPRTGNSTALAGANGSPYGGGGSGASSPSGTSGQAGGDGADGIVIVTEYY